MEWIGRAEEVAAGRINATCVELVELIRAVNPTSHHLTRALAETRYRLKSRLQSLLLVHDGAHLVVTLTADPNVIGLLHLGRPVAHAKVDSLERDARRWLGTRCDPVALGRASQREGDLASARSYFESAANRGCVRGAAALVGLLAETSPEEALAWEPRLGASAREPWLRIRLALAHARTGARREALRRVADLDAPEVWVAVVMGALDSGALAEAREHLRGAERRRIDHPELADIRRALFRRRRQR